MSDGKVAHHHPGCDYPKPGDYLCTCAVRKELDLRADLARVTAERDEAQAKADVRGGEWCAQNRAEGRGPCGACAWCCVSLREMLARAESERDRMRAVVEAARSFDAALRATQDTSVHGYRQAEIMRRLAAYDAALAAFRAALAALDETTATREDET